MTAIIENRTNIPASIAIFFILWNCFKIHLRNRWSYRNNFCQEIVLAMVKCSRINFCFININCWRNWFVFFTSAILILFKLTPSIELVVVSCKLGSGYMDLQSSNKDVNTLNRLTHHGPNLEFSAFKVRYWFWHFIGIYHWKSKYCVYHWKAYWSGFSN